MLNRNRRMTTNVYGMMKSSYRFSRFIIHIIMNIVYILYYTLVYRYHTIIGIILLSIYYIIIYYVRMCSSSLLFDFSPDNVSM